MDYISKEIKKIKKQYIPRFKNCNFEDYIKIKIEIKNFYEDKKEILIKNKKCLIKRLNYVNLKINKAINIKEIFIITFVTVIAVTILKFCSNTFKDYLENELPKIEKNYNEMVKEVNKINPNINTIDYYEDKQMKCEIENLLKKLNMLIIVQKIITFLGIIYYLIAIKFIEKVMNIIFIEYDFYLQKLYVYELNIINDLLCENFIFEQLNMKITTENELINNSSDDCILISRKKDEINKIDKNLKIIENDKKRDLEELLIKIINLLEKQEKENMEDK